MERASSFQLGLAGAVASGGGLLERASHNSFHTGCTVAS